MATKSANLYARIEPDVKKEAENSYLSEDELDEELNKGYEDMKNGRTVDAKQAFAEIHKKYDI